MNDYDDLQVEEFSHFDFVEEMSENLVDNENPTEETIIETIEDCVMGSLHEYFTFDDEDLS